MSESESNPNQEQKQQPLTSSSTIATSAKTGKYTSLINPHFTSGISIIFLLF